MLALKTHGFVVAFRYYILLWIFLQQQFSILDYLICSFCICVADHGYCKIFWREIIQEKSSQQIDEPKKQKEGSRNESSTSTLDSVFAEGLKNLDCVLILPNCLRSLEQQVKKTFDLAKKSSESQIKDEVALQDVSKAISFIGERFDAYEQERRGNEKKMKN